MRQGIGILVCLAIGSTNAQAAMLIDNYSDATNDRFENADSPDQFFMNQYDLSGVGQNSSGRWATLIAPNVIISANHFKATGTITFHEDNDPNGAVIEVDVTSDQLRVNGTDLWIARLEHAVPSYITTYAYATTDINSTIFNKNPYFGETVFMTGRSPQSNPSNEDQAFGTNKVDGFVLNNTSVGLGSVDALKLSYNSGATTYESFFQSGDSGAPLLYDDGSGDLTLLGINSYITTNISGNPVASYASYTGNESSTIDSQIATWSALIPDPGDFNGDDVIDATDIDLLYDEINAGTNAFYFDLNEDRVVDQLDQDLLVQDILGTEYGDADLDGVIGVLDLSLLASNYGSTSNTSWAKGDFNGDGLIDVLDLSLLAANYGAGQVAPQPIPEPGALLLLSFAATASLVRRRSH